MPDQFVLKTNNGCGNNIIVRDKSELDTTATRKKLDYLDSFSLRRHYRTDSLCAYPPRIIAESYLEQDKNNPDNLPCDYKFFCFKGKPYYILYYEGRKINGHITPNMLFDMDWTPLPEAVLRPTTHDIPKPVSFDEMKELATKLAQGIDFARHRFLRNQRETHIWRNNSYTGY